jgi:hypothetical protein
VSIVTADGATLLYGTADSVAVSWRARGFTRADGRAANAARPITFPGARRSTNPDIDRGTYFQRACSNAEMIDV